MRHVYNIYIQNKYGINDISFPIACFHFKKKLRNFGMILSINSLKHTYIILS